MIPNDNYELSQWTDVLSNDFGTEVQDNGKEYNFRRNYQQ